MSLTVLYRLQFFYASLGISYNLVSLILQQSGADPLSATSAVSGIAAMIVYLLFLIPGVLKLRSLYRALMAVATVVLGYGGVITHLMNINDLQLYSSIAAWIIAIVINLFGLILNVTALSEGIHEQSEKGKRQQQSEETKQRLLVNGCHLFREKGFHQVTVDDIISNLRYENAGV
ncbi:hypothetical protein GEMRC1_011942 [Eukaryota sp. GEM-RC1]